MTEVDVRRLSADHPTPRLAGSWAGCLEVEGREDPLYLPSGYTTIQGAVAAALATEPRSTTVPKMWEEKGGAEAWVDHVYACTSCPAHHDPSVLDG